MSDIADHHALRVFPEVRVRQWVLTLPFELRYRAAFDHGLALAIWRIAVRVIDGRYRKVVRADRRGGARVQGGSVTTIHRFGSDLRLNRRFHGLLLDGAFALEPHGGPRFVPASAPSVEEMASLLTTIAVRVRRLLKRRGIAIGDRRGDAANER